MDDDVEPAAGTSHGARYAGFGLSKVINGDITLLKWHVLLTRFPADTCYYLDKGYLGDVEPMPLGWLMNRIYPLMPGFLKVPLHNGQRVEKVEGH